MVRRVFLGHPTAARSALRLALAPTQRKFGQPVSSIQTLGTASKAAAETKARVIESTRRMQAFEPLEGLESLERLLKRREGAIALSTVLGLEARQDYAHGADLEANSCVGPLLAALPCVLSLSEHTKNSAETLDETIAGTSEGLHSDRVPVAHRLAKRAAELRAPKNSHRGVKALVHQFDMYLKQVSRNRQAFVELIQTSLVMVRHAPLSRVPWPYVTCVTPLLFAGIWCYCCLDLYLFL